MLLKVILEEFLETVEIDTGQDVHHFSSDIDEKCGDHVDEAPVVGRLLVVDIVLEEEEPCLFNV